jgi:hypothetical protein
MEDMGFLPTPSGGSRNMAITADMNRVPTKSKDITTNPWSPEDLKRMIATEMYKGEG